MRSLIAVACLALSVGCASLGPLPGEEPGPLRAYLLPLSSETGDLSFHVSKPAHVAVFRIVPGQGTQMIYPYAGISARNSFASSGFHSMGFGRRNNDVMFASFPNSAYYGPIFYFLIASEEPLGIDRFGDYGTRLHTVMGNSFSFNAYGAMERLVSLAVPNVASESWTTDFYVHWPEETQNPSRRTYVQIACNGGVITVPIESAQWTAEQLCDRPQVDPDQPPVDAPQDSVVDLRRRDPVQPTDRISSIQLTDPEAWEQLRGFAEEAVVSTDLRARGAFRENETAAAASSIGSVDRSRPMSARQRSEAAGSGTGSSDVPPAIRPAANPSREPSSQPYERARPEPADNGSVSRPLAPTQTE